MSKKLTAVGITCAIGSMLVGAKQARFKVLGNIEWRKYYHAKDEEGRDTFSENFFPAFMKQRLEDLTPKEMARVTGVDLAMGHPECGSFSQMQGCNNFRGADTAAKKAKNPMDIPLFVELIGQIKPRFFVMDDLPKSLGAYPMSEYAKGLPDYDLFPEWISNYHYGNIQKNRRRMFMIGARKSEKFVFVPGEEEHTITLRDVIGDLLVNPVKGAIPNHDRHTESRPSGRGLHMNRLWHRPTWGEMKAWFAARPEGSLYEYHSTSGGIKKKPGWAKQRWEGHCHVLDGGSGHMHPKRNLPFTIRERARIQGFPDSFIFYGTKFDEKQEWMFEQNVHMIKQTGKAMPVQFCQYIARQVRAHIAGRTFQASEAREVKSNEYIDEAKQWYCSEVGYSDQSRACQQCWLFPQCESPSRKGERGKESPLILPGKKKSLPGKKKKVKQRKPRVSAPIPVVKTTIRRFQKRKGLPSLVSVDAVHLVKKVLPKEYHCKCRFCRRSIGELRNKSGEYYSRLERRKYYDQSEKGRTGHIAKTPLHIARWAVQRYTQPGDWVLDPTIGAGTTAVEALIQGRCAAGMELQSGKILLANMKKFTGRKRRAIIGEGDARNIAPFLRKVGRVFQLILNNPPYSGDEHAGVGMSNDRKDWTTKYDHTLPNLAFLKEGAEYWKVIEKIYRGSIHYLAPGGRFVIGVKDQMRQKKPDQLHEKFALVLENLGLVHEGTAFLKHYPGTLHLHTYFKRYGVHPPYYQTILVFRKER